MIKEDIEKSLEAMLVNPKAKNFLNHLVRSYVPPTNVVRLMSKPTGDFNCVLTKDVLKSVEELVPLEEVGGSSEERAEYIKEMFKNTNTEKLNTMMRDSNVGVTGANTNTFMSFLSYEIFYDWIIAKSLKGDKHINWLLGSIKHKSFMERAEKMNDFAIQQKVAKMKKQEENGGRATYSLGSLEALQKLKEKFKETE